MYCFTIYIYISYILYIFLYIKHYKYIHTNTVISSEWGHSLMCLWVYGERKREKTINVMECEKLWIEVILKKMWFGGKGYMGVFCIILAIFL